MPRHILHIFPSFEVGGAQRRFAALLAQGGGGFRHTVFAMDGCYDALKLMNRDTVAQLETPPIAKGASWQAIRHCRTILAGVQPDLLVTYNWGSVEWALANRFAPICPMVHVQDGFGSDELGREKASRRIARAFTYRGADAVVVPSRTLEQIARNSWRIPQARLKYIPNGIDVMRFGGERDSDFLAQFGLTDDDRIIGTVAGLRPEKNIGRLIEAYHSLLNDFADIRLVIVGDGVGKSALKMLAERIGLKQRIIFTGNLPEPERILPAFEIFALSSDTEQMPLSVVEAMAAGLPVASTDVGDIARMVAHENRPFIQGREAPELAESLAALLSDQDNARAIGAANKAKARAEFGFAAMAAAYDRLYGSLADRRGQPR
ncbi:MAG: glycosyltransferase family 1 protein [Alphaproteobacteria bacterium]|nr:MAG: glycosyltransferase family 1 protein [Alphaproteobacteria bacterium]